MSYQYKMYNSRRIRPFTKHIIITHARNLIEKFYISPEVVAGNNYFTLGIMENYFMYSLKKNTLPYHYYVDNVGDDWYISKGLCEFQPSYFIEDMVSSGVIKYDYLNSIIIVISEDFSRYPVDNRMSEQLCQKLLSDIMRRYEIKYSHVHYIDDCLHDNWEENLRTSSLEYKYTKAKYFDFQKIKMNINKFKKTT